MRDSSRSSQESSSPPTVEFFDLADFLDLVCLAIQDVDGLTSIGSSFGFTDFLAADFSFLIAGALFPASFFNCFGCDSDGCMSSWCVTFCFLESLDVLEVRFQAV